jgi:hypothetical protein
MPFTLPDSPRDRRRVALRAYHVIRVYGSEAKPVGCLDMPMPTHSVKAVRHSPGVSSPQCRVHAYLRWIVTALSAEWNVRRIEDAGL